MGTREKGKRSDLVSYDTPSDPEIKDEFKKRRKRFHCEIMHGEAEPSQVVSRRHHERQYVRPAGSSRPPQQESILAYLTPGRSKVEVDFLDEDLVTFLSLHRAEKVVVPNSSCEPGNKLIGKSVGHVLEALDQQGINTETPGERAGELV